MLTAIAVLLSLGFIGWLIWWAVKRRPIKAHTLMYLLAILTGVYTIGFFLTMNLPTTVKVLVSIVLGIILIALAAWFQQRRQTTQT